MAMFVKQSLSNEERMARDIERRRKLEEERKSRVFNAKQRTIGVDTKALDEQVRERQRRQQEEKEADLSYDAHMLQITSAVKCEHARQSRLRAEAEAQCKRYNLENLRKETRREFELSDPQALKNTSLPIPEETGPASLMRLEGEDSHFQQRKSDQAAQMRQWIQQQIFEKKMKEEEEKEEENRWAAHTRDTSHFLQSVEQRKKEMQAQEAKEVMMSNSLMAREKFAACVAQLETEELEGQKEVQHWLSDPMLADGRLDLTVSTAASGSDMGGDAAVLGTMREGFKGTTLAQKVETLQTNLDQWKSKEERKAAEREEEKRNAEREEMQRRALLIMERENRQQRRQLEKEMNATNHLLATEQRTGAALLKNEVYTNYPTEDYYKHFGTTAR